MAGNVMLQVILDGLYAVDGTEEHARLFCATFGVNLRHSRSLCGKCCYVALRSHRVSGLEIMRRAVK